jgi:signal recognition particle GTPase
MITTRYTNIYNPRSSNKNVSCRRFTIDERNNWATDDSGDELCRHKDKFIELAQAALEEAKMEEEQKGVLQELVEALITRTGAPMVADVILEQFRSQDVIERLAEDHFEQQERRRSTDNSSEQTLKEPSSEAHEKIITTHHSHIDTIMLISEYLWRVFRLLLLSSLVGLIYHFMCAQNQPLLTNL